MRTLSLFLVSVVLLAGCEQSPDPALQGRVDSLQSANDTLEDQVSSLRDSLRAQSEGTALEPAVYFPSGSAWLFDSAKERLDEHAETIQDEYPEANFHIRGYTDNVPIGPDLRDTYPSNWYLSAQRAAAVAHYLDTEHGIRSEGLEIEAFGARSPLGPNETPEGRRENRRVEIVVEDGS
ncbi:MAG: OmpA family protein [Salinivenus sp.]